MMRQILIPAMACSARTRTRASLRFLRFSAGLNACFFPFLFSVAEAPALPGHSREAPGHCGASCFAESGSRHDRRLSCRERNPAGFGLESSPAWSACSRQPCFYPRGLSSCRCNESPVFPGVLAAVGAVRRHPQSDRSFHSGGAHAGLLPGRRARASPPACLTRVPRRAITAECNGWRSAGSSQPAAPARPGGDTSWCAPG